MSTFLSTLYIENIGGIVSINDFVEKLKDFPNGGSEVYRSNRTTKPLQKVYLESTLLQLLSVKILVLNPHYGDNDDSGRQSMKIGVSLGLSPNTNLPMYPHF